MPINYYKVKLCGCESGEYRYPLFDGHGLFLTYACDKCEKKKLSRYRSDIMEPYDCDEQIEPEEYYGSQYDDWY